MKKANKKETTKEITKEQVKERLTWDQRKYLAKRLETFKSEAYTKLNAPIEPARGRRRANVFLAYIKTKEGQKAFLNAVINGLSTYDIKDWTAYIDVPSSYAHMDGLKDKFAALDKELNDEYRKKNERYQRFCRLIDRLKDVAMLGTGTETCNLLKMIDEKLQDNDVTQEQLLSIMEELANGKE